MFLKNMVEARRLVRSKVNGDDKCVFADIYMYTMIGKHTSHYACEYTHI